ncbi:MAG: signal peptidase II [Firmicutes bacterium]|nr:signal peptidase II [Bacillota bacterium]
MIYILIIVGVMVLDRIVKTAVDNGMNVGDTIPVLGDFFHITYIRNTGAAFSMLQGHPTLLIVLPGAIIFVAIIFIVAKHKSYKPVFPVALSLMCGGGLGNLTDRAAYGYVIDMFDFGWFPVFNVADIAVCVGCGMLLLYMIVYNNKNPE